MSGVAGRINKLVNRSFDIILLCLFIFILAVGLLLYGINSYLESNKTKIIDNISFLQEAHVRFGESYITIFRDFPNASLIIRDVAVRDSSYHKTKNPVLFINELQVEISIVDWRQKDVKIQSLEINGGEINLIADAEGNYNIATILSGLQNQNQHEEENNSDLTIDSKNIDLSLSDFDFIIYDTLRTTSIRVTANSLGTKLINDNGNIQGDLEFDVNVEELTFEKENGSFLKGAHLVGKTKTRFIANKLSLDPFEIMIDDRPFSFEAEVVTDGSEPTVLFIKNDHLNFQQLKQLLSPNIAKTLKPYNVKQAFPASADITINSGDPVKVEVDFALKHHDIAINDIPFSNTKLKGRFINRNMMILELILNQMDISDFS